MSGTDWSFFKAGENKVDHLVTLVWVLVFVAWVWATVHNFLVGSYELAELPTGLATVLVAIPLSKAVVEGARALKGP